MRYHPHRQKSCLAQIDVVFGTAVNGGAIVVGVAIAGAAVVGGAVLAVAAQTDGGTVVVPTVATSSCCG